MDDFPTRRTPAHQDRLLSIGELAEAVGISGETLRVWERRYGRPQPRRLPSGHRRYDADDVRWLRRVAEAIALGHRPGLVVRADDSELERLLERNGGGPDDPEAWREAELIDATRSFRAGEIDELFATGHAELGPREFCASCLAPLLVRVGRMWAAGELEVRHEHFLSGLVGDFLRRRIDELEIPPGPPQILLTTLPGEEHVLGLRMVAYLCGLRGVRAWQLGRELPIDEIERAAIELEIRAVLIGVSLASGGTETDRTLAQLRKELPEEIDLLVGGGGARGVRRGPRGVAYAESLAEVDEWLAAFEERAAAHAPGPAR
jgi:methanogenic corrinoid protein MtbC1